MLDSEQTGSLSQSGGYKLVGAEKNVKALAGALHFMDAFRTVRPTMPLQHAYAFTLVAMEEGLGVNEYAERAGVSQTVMTRHLLDIGTMNRKREPGYGLIIQRQDPNDLRKHQSYLTNEGKALLFKILRALG